MDYVEYSAANIGEYNYFERGVVLPCDSKYNKPIRHENNKPIGNCF